MLTIDDNITNLVEQSRFVAEGSIATMAEIVVSQSLATQAYTSLKSDIVHVLGLAGYTAAGEFAVDAIALGDRFALGDALTKPYGDLPGFCDSDSLAHGVTAIVRRAGQISVETLNWRDTPCPECQPCWMA